MYKITFISFTCRLLSYISLLHHPTDHDFSINYLKTMQLSICCYAYDIFMPFQQERTEELDLIAVVISQVIVKSAISYYLGYKPGL